MKPDQTDTKTVQQSGGAAASGALLDILAKKLKDVLVEVRLVAEPPAAVTRWARTKEREAELLENWVQEFRDFLRDHRSQDPVSLEVKRVKKDLCSECESEWETMEDNGKTFCASCGREVEDVNVGFSDAREKTL